MSLWSKDKKPTWLTEAQKEKCFATKRGWVLKRNNGIEELIVPMKGLNLTSIEKVISLISVSLYAKKFEKAKKLNVKLAFDEAVTLDENYKLVLQFGEEEPKLVELELSKGNGTNLITFEYIIDEEIGEIIIPSINCSGFDLSKFDYEGQKEFPIKTGILVNQSN